jgi:hypothetical protein
MRKTAFYQRAFLACTLVGVGSAAALLNEAPEPPKVSSFAPADDLLQQVGFFTGRVEESLATKDGYDEAKQARTLKDGNTLAVLALMLGKHDEANKLKDSAPAMIAAAQALAKGAKDYDAASMAFADLKKAVAGEAGAGGEVKWEKVASLGALMKQVPLVHTGLKRGVTGTRFERQLPEIAGQSATIAAIAQASMFDTHEVKDPADTPKWYAFCAELRDSAGEVNAAAKAKDQAKAKAALTKLNQSCDHCHEVFRKEHQ